VEIKNLTIEPTGTCFDDSIHLFGIFAKNPRAEVLLVHGICKKRDSGDLFSHAWVERNGECYFAGIINKEKVGLSASLPEFYEYFRVTDDVTKYTLENILQFEDLHSRKSGPWEARYEALTKEGKIENEKTSLTCGDDVANDSTSV